MIAIATIHLKDPLSWPDLREKLYDIGDPEYAFIDSHLFEDLVRKSYPTAAVRDGSHLLGIRVGRTLVLPVWDGDAEVVEIEVEFGKA